MSETAVKEIKTAEAVRQALAELGVDAKSPDILVRAQEIAGRPISKQTVYQYKSNIKQGRDSGKGSEEKKASEPKAKAKAKPKAKAHKPAMAPRKTKEENSFSDMRKMFAIVKSLQDLCNQAGGKENVASLMEFVS
jgi:hypothetical protein